MSKILLQEKLSFKLQPPIQNAASLHILKICEKVVRLKMKNYGSYNYITNTNFWLQYLSSLAASPFTWLITCIWGTSGA